MNVACFFHNLGIAPDNLVLQPMLSFLGKQGTINEVEYYFSLFKKYKLEPNEVTYTIMADSYARVGDVPNMHKYIDLIPANSRNEGIYNIILTAYSRKGDLPNMLKHFQEMVASGI